MYPGHQHSCDGWTAEPRSQAPRAGSKTGRSLHCNRPRVITGFQIKDVQGSTRASHRNLLYRRGSFLSWSSSFSAGLTLTLPMERIFQGLCPASASHLKPPLLSRTLPLPSCYLVALSYFVSAS